MQDKETEKLESVGGVDNPATNSAIAANDAAAETNFAADLEKSLHRLKLLTGQLPNLVSAAHSRLAA